MQTEPGLPAASGADWARVMPSLHAWANRYFRFVGPCTIEWSFAVQQWQAAVGHPVTGVMTAKDFRALVAAADTQAQKARQP